MKKIFASLVLLMAGCITTPHNYNDPVDPSQVTSEDLENHALALEDRYQQYHQVEGIIWQRYRSDAALAEPDKYGSGGDSCIFTGTKLAADVYRYGVTGTSEDLDSVLQSLRGLYILSHITGTPGVFARAAFPADRAAEWNYPEAWGGRDPLFVHTSSSDVADPFNPGTNFPPMVYYTRSTKDQLTGLLYGLSVTWKLLEAKDSSHETRVNLAKNVVARISEDVYNHLRANDFKIVDENGNNDTSADSVSGLIRLQLLAIYKATVSSTSPHRMARIVKKYEDQFPGSFFNIADTVHVFTNYDAYYAWNLRHTRAYSIFILEENYKRREIISNWYQDRLWQYISGHLNAKFIYMQNHVTPGLGKLSDAYLSLQSLRLKPIRSYDSPLAGDERKPSLLQVLWGDTDRFVLLPHLRKPTDYTIWQKEPWDSGSPGNNGSANTTGLDFMLAYWMGRYHGFLNK